jgi:hypothetical protein
MKEIDQIRSVAPAALTAARFMTHKSVQLVSMAARVNLDAKDDDSHANLGWHRGFNGFLSRPIGKGEKSVEVALIPDHFELAIYRGADRLVSLALEGVAVGDADAWLDAELEKLALKPIAGQLPSYEMPTETDAIAAYSKEGQADNFAALSAWFSLSAAILSEFAGRNAALSPGPVRCWAHHYDLATEVTFDGASAESTTTIGVGFSPGDEQYGEPYYYVSPWSEIDVKELPAPPVTGHWHTDGFVGIVASATEALSLADMRRELPAFIEGGFRICRDKLGV